MLLELGKHSKLVISLIKFDDGSVANPESCPGQCERETTGREYTTCQMFQTEYTTLFLYWIELWKRLGLLGSTLPPILIGR
jgi:hypothetical protein